MDHWDAPGFTVNTLPSREGVVLLEITGELDLFVAPDLRAALDAAATENHHVCLDMTGVPFVDSTALATLLNVRRRLRDGGAQLVVVGVTGQVATTLDQTGLDGLIPRHESIDDALAALPA